METKPEGTRTCPACGGRGEFYEGMASYDGGGGDKIYSKCRLCNGKGHLTPKEVESLVESVSSQTKKT